LNRRFTHTSIIRGLGGDILSAGWPSEQFEGDILRAVPGGLVSVMPDGFMGVMPLAVMM
jgi:hypothetical protein